MMKKKLFSCFLFLTAVFFVMVSCKTEHKVAIETNKPIKIEARIDIYLHAVSIEDMVSGKTSIPEAETPKENRESLLYRAYHILTGIKEAYAEDIPFQTVTQEIRDTLLRRKNRYQQIQDLISAGKAQENTKGYLVLAQNLSDAEKKVIDEENADRKFIYQELASQNNLTLTKVEQAFAKVHNKK